jgi:hypothetical protein
VGSAATSWADPFRATPRHGARRTADRKRATPISRWAAAWRASRRAPGPSLARHRSCRQSSSSRQCPRRACRRAAVALRLSQWRRWHRASSCHMTPGHQGCPPVDLTLLAHIAPLIGCPRWTAIDIEGSAPDGNATRGTQPPQRPRDLRRVGALKPTSAGQRQTTAEGPPTGVSAGQRPF